MAKLTKEEIKLHEQALRILEKDILTFDDKLFVLDHWHEGANHMNAAAGAFFTPETIAWALASEMCGSANKSYVDLCAGIGRLAFSVLTRQEPFKRHAGESDIEITCVEINPAYVEVGKKILPSARWICADVCSLADDIGHFDCAISNPPFGRSVGSDCRSPRLSSGPFEYKVIDIASSLADSGAFIIPQQSSPFQFSGKRDNTFIKSREYMKFEERTGIVLDYGCANDTTVDAEWRGVNVVVEIALADFTQARLHHNHVDMPIQGQLFPLAA
jgi:hypothetical protein